MALIPEVLVKHINEAFPENVCLVATSLPNGYAQVSPRGSVHVYDGDTLAYWDRGTGTTHDSVQTGSKVTIYFRNGKLGRQGLNLLPAGGIARFYGTAEVFTADGPEREKAWNGMVQPERDRDPDKAGRAVLVRLERAEQLTNAPLADIF